MSSTSNVTVQTPRRGTQKLVNAVDRNWPSVFVHVATALFLVLFISYVVADTRTLGNRLKRGEGGDGGVCGRFRIVR